MELVSLILLLGWDSWGLDKGFGCKGLQLCLSTSCGFQASKFKSRRGAVAPSSGSSARPVNFAKSMILSGWGFLSKLIWQKINGYYEQRTNFCNTILGIFWAPRSLTSSKSIQKNQEQFFLQNVRFDVVVWWRCFRLVFQNPSLTVVCWQQGSYLAYYAADSAATARKSVLYIEDLFKHDDIHNLPQSQASYSCFWFCKETKGNEAVDFVTSFFTFSALPHFANRCKGSYFLHCVALVSVIVHDLQEAGFWGSECHNTTMEVPNHVRHSRLPELSLKAIGESPLRRSQRRGETEGADMPTAAIWPFGAISTNLLSARLWWNPSDMLKFDHWEA